MISKISSENIWKAAIVLVFTAFIAAPYITLNGAVKGVHLWFNTVLPGMLPCIIMSNLIVNTYGNSLKYPWLYIIITGLFCGYPMGAKSCADLYGHTASDAARTQFLLAVCNYSSPSFIMGYCISQALGMKEHTLVILAAIYIPVVCCLAFELIKNRCFYFKNDFRDTRLSVRPSDRTPVIRRVDEAILNGFEIITKLGGYIILFTIFSEFIAALPVSRNIHIVICAVSEITTGTAAICAANIPPAVRIAAVCTTIAFGGLSCVAQTRSVISGTFYSLKKYTYHKLCLSALTAISAIICVYIFIL